MKILILVITIILAAAYIFLDLPAAGANEKEITLLQCLLLVSTCTVAPVFSYKLLSTIPKLKVFRALKTPALLTGLIVGFILLVPDSAKAQANVCDGRTYRITSSGASNGLSFKRWEYSSVSSAGPYTTIPDATEQDYVFTASLTPNNSGYYRALYSNPSGVNTWYYLIHIVVNPTPGAPTITNGSRCGSGSVTLSAGGALSGDTYNWYSTSTGGTPLVTSTSYTTPNISTSTTYYVAAVNAAGCESNRVAVTAIVNPIPAAPTTTDGERDDPGSVTLSAAGAPSGGSYQWFNVDGTLISGETNATYTTPHLSSTTDYYVSVVGSGSCASSRTLVTARILLTSPMPISLAYFKGEVAERQVHLLWTTASEENNDRFEIERSKDGENFKMIGTVKGNGNSYQLLHYNFTDTHPGSGTIYYRLKQVDLSGSYSYSKVISLSLGHLPATGLAQTYPNPFTTELHALITIPTTGEVTISVVDVGGKVVHYDKQSMLAGLNKVTLPLADLSSGLYLLKIVCPTASITAKVIKSP